MKKRLLILLSGSLFITFAGFAQESKAPVDWALFGRYAKANEQLSAPPKAVFLGNSITEGWWMVDSAFFKNNNYLGRGISGQTTAEMLVRFRADVINLKPQAVVILAGTNDLARNIGYISLENIFGNIVSMAELARLHNIRPVLCSILPVYDYRWRPGLEPAGKIVQLNNLLKEYAAENNCAYVDYHSALKDERNGLPEKYSYDGVHVNPAGYKILEEIVQETLLKVLK
jgi:lysophospholipase L1-like esterase